MKSEYKDYGFTNADPTHMHQHFMPAVISLAEQNAPGTDGRSENGQGLQGKRVLDVGCGNGFTCGEFLKRGCVVVGIDLGKQGVIQARKAYPQGRFDVLPADELILEHLGEEPFDIVVSTEVVEHLYDPKSYAHGCFVALKPGGRFLCTTPYHGYLKNLALSLAGKWDSHANPLWDGGHIKLWSKKTLFRLLAETGFTNLQFRGIGRFPYLWMTMLVSGIKPG